VDRGGSVTFHGPGQLVGYPILSLALAFPIPGAPGRGDAVAYVRALEGALIATAGRYGVLAVRRHGMSGAWVGRNKLAAIGVKLARGVTQHGVALNVTTDLGWFAHVTPCGIEDGGVTSLAAEGAVGLTPRVVGDDFAACLAEGIGARLEAAGPALRRLAGAPVTESDRRGGGAPVAV
jgi:lipoyl(octanoyl) transferase